MGSIILCISAFLYVQINVCVQVHMHEGAYVYIFMEWAQAKCPYPGTIPTLFIILFIYFSTILSLTGAPLVDYTSLRVSSQETPIFCIPSAVRASGLPKGILCEVVEIPIQVFMLVKQHIFY